MHDVDGWRRKAYPGANAAIARHNFNLLEWFALEIIGDITTMAASSIALGGFVSI